jgi:hypothetical protein
MPDLLVLTRNYKTGDLRMAMEIDPEPKVPDPKEFKNLPVPVRGALRTFNTWIKDHREDVDWLQGQIEDFLLTYDWGVDVTADINWPHVFKDVMHFAYDTRRR